MWKIFNKKSNKEDKVRDSSSEIRGGEKTTADSADSTDKKDKKEDKKEKKEKTSSAKTSGSKNVSANKLTAGYGIFIKPIVSEKTASMGSHDIYAFEVNKSTNKVEIQKAFNSMYGVKPLSVRIINMPSKTKRFGKNIGTQSAWKKAYVRIPKGSNVSIYEGV